ncbi:alpha/beta fold hydrolase [Buchnera aphidicola]|uniref:AB hydrolase-1 domain-containing protein n=1 Tax=Buchnera aphidicola (Lipaphis pseudobrassicae) TaxID=1258543 RepID=A0A4D6Y0Y9_9GAMM|nr:alpha/beta fold hydrolase [Buchnera aphidicola]QCI22369.1 hypothetical protein D9V70_02805 [Buchnera aphidicola (Lipaphis pseudobrassicae)]
MFENFYLNLQKNYFKTINNFFNLHTINSTECKQDLIVLKQILYSEIPPSTNFLKNSLQIIFNLDLRSDISFLSIPILRIYGSLDNLIPIKIAKILDKKWPKTRSIIIKKSGHIPFVSHKIEFCCKLLDFLKLF